MARGIIPHGGENDDVLFSPLETVDGLDFDGWYLCGAKFTEDVNKLFLPVSINSERPLEQ